MAVHRKFDIIGVVALAVGLAAYAAFQPRSHLNTTTPPEFFDASAYTPGQKRAEEKRIADAYWKCAVRQIQWKYGYANRLPEDPPAEFAVTTEEAGPGANDPAVRLRYWQKLRRIWYVPSIWKKDYGLDLTSMKRSFQSAGDWMQNQMWRITGGP